MRLVFKLLGGAVALCVVVAALLLWRLGRGPISLDFLTPRIEAAVREADPALQIGIGSTQLAWDRERHRVDLCAKDVRIGEGSQSIAIPSVALSLDAVALLRGRLALGAIDFVGPHLRLVRDSDGRIGLGVEGAASPSGGPEGMLGSAFLGRFEPGRFALRQIGVRDGALSIDDRASGQVWQLDHLDLSISLQPDALDCEGNAEVDLTPLLGAASPRAGAATNTARLGAKVVFHQGDDRLDLDEVSIDLADAAIRGSGRVGGIRAGPLRLSAGVKLALFPVDALASYWPPAMAVSAREWVTQNISGGRVKDAELQLTANAGDGGQLGVAALAGSLAFEDLSVRYLDSMPPVTGVTGRATVSLEGAEFQVAGGQLRDIAVSKAKVRLPADGEARIAIEAGVSGPLSSVVSVLDNPPVELTEALGLRPSAGSVSGRLGLAFPLRDKLGLGDLGLTVSAELRGVAVERVAGDLSVSDGDLSLSMRGAEVTLAGDGRLQGVPLRLDLRDTIGAQGARHIEVKGDIDREGWKNLGFDPGTWVEGSSAVTAAVTVVDGGDIILDATADLARTTLALPVATLAKAEDVPGTASARIRFSDGALTAVERGDLSFAGNSLHGSAGRTLRGGWSSLSARATLAPQTDDEVAGQLVLDVGEDGTFNLTSPDAGALLHSLGREHGERGEVALQGTVALETGLPFDGKLVMTDFTVTNEPILAQVLTLASVHGLLGALTREGIFLERVTANLSQRGGVLTVGDGVARGQSLTFMSSGTIGLESSTVDLKGRVIPSYFGINQGVAKIPLIGGLLTGDEAQAVQAIDFTATGPASSPVVKVNSLSSLAPQALQDLLRHLP